MTEKPIIFSGPMVRAILDCRKTMTRRVLKHQPTPPSDSNGLWHVHNRHGGNFCPEHEVGTAAIDYCPISVGDTLWVREAFATDGPRVLYVETDDIHPLRKIKPSIHMPRWASRITLEVTAVKVERLQDISEEDAKAEGVTAIHHGDGEYYYSAFRDEPDGQNWADPADAFIELWDSINGTGSWDANPWVAVYTFERVKP